MKKDDKSPVRDKNAVPEAMQTQLAQLFGTGSREAGNSTRTSAEWRKTLKAVLREMRLYIAENVDTDELHLSMLRWGLDAASESLKDGDFWPGYAEGITRIALILLGDYPNHRKRKPGRKKDSYYSLNLYRSCQWVQTPEQRFRTVMAAGNLGYPKLSASPRAVLDEFRRQFGFKRSKLDHAHFMEWYRTKFPLDYAALFR